MKEKLLYRGRQTAEPACIVLYMSTGTQPLQTITTAIEKMSTEVILGAIEILVAKPVLEAAERAMKACMVDVIAARLNITAELNAIYEDDDFYGTAYDAILLARAA